MKLLGKKTSGLLCSACCNSDSDLDKQPEGGWINDGYIYINSSQIQRSTAAFTVLEYVLAS